MNFHGHFYVDTDGIARITRNVMPWVCFFIFSGCFSHALETATQQTIRIAAKVHMQFATHNKPIAIFYSQIRYKIKNFEQILDILTL